VIDYGHVCQMLGADRDDLATPEMWWADHVYLALCAAHDLATAGIPVFVAYPND